MGSQRVGHDWATELNWTELIISCINHWTVVAQSLSLIWLFCDLMDCGPPGPSLHGIVQARTLESVATSSRGSSWPRDQTHVSCICRWILHLWVTREVQNQLYSNLKKIKKERKVGGKWIWQICTRTGSSPSQGIRTLSHLRLLSFPCSPCAQPLVAAVDPPHSFAHSFPQPTRPERWLSQLPQATDAPASLSSPLVPGSCLWRSRSYQWKMLHF